MATLDKDFKVKNGLQVAGPAYIAGTMAVGSVSEDSHAATKGYVESKAFAEVSATEPADLFPGKMWIDSAEGRLKIYSGTAWTTVAKKEDADFLQDHIHDDAIEGTGQVIEVIN
jgi:hypothetical protein